MRVDPSTVASWGNLEDRPARDRMRGLCVGRGFMVLFHEAEGGTKQHRDKAWIDWVRENTAIEIRWMWSRDLQYIRKNADVYAQVAGELILEETAKGTLPSGRWFRTDLSQHYGWLFEPACLRHDGWKLVDLKTNDGRTYESWTKANA